MKIIENMDIINIFIPAPDDQLDGRALNKSGQ